IGQRDDDVGLADREPFDRGGGEVGEVVGETADERLRVERRSGGANDADAVAPLGCGDLRVGSQRVPGDNRNIPAMDTDEIFGKLREELAGCAKVWPVGAVEEADVHQGAGGRWQ